MAPGAVSTAGSNPAHALTSSSLADSRVRVRSPQTVNASPVASSATSTTASTQQQQTGAAPGSDANISPSSFSRLRIDLNALGTAISLGNLRSAQSAYATVEGDLRSIPNQLLSKANDGVAQTVQRADMLINFLSSIKDAVSPRQSPGPSSRTTLAPPLGATVDLYA